MRAGYRHILFLYILLFFSHLFSPLALAQVEVVIDNMYVRDILFAKIDGGKIVKSDLFQMQTEEQSSGYVYTITSADVPQPLIQHDTNFFEKVKVYLDIEKWRVSGYSSYSDKEILRPTLFLGNGESALLPYEYNARIEAAKAEQLLRVGESFVTKELPHLDQRNATVFVEIIQPAQITCKKLEDSKELGCQQVLHLRFKLQTDEYEGFRHKGIEPIYVLRGENQDA